MPRWTSSRAESILRVARPRTIAWQRTTTCTARARRAAAACAADITATPAVATFDARRHAVFAANCVGIAFGAAGSHVNV